jgi:hypothetical protein
MKEVKMGWTCNLDRGNKKCIQNFGVETCWKVAIWKTAKGIDFKENKLWVWKVG